MQYRLSPSGNISARSFGDEVIAANFLKGVYYSLLGSAAQIWEGLLAGVPFDQVVARVGALSDADNTEFETAARELVDALLQENLLLPANGVTPGTWNPVAGAEGPYGLPVLERFTDMEELLILDPVHDVEDMGWPHANPTQTS
jgi:hypothetical protein